MAKDDLQKRFQFKRTIYFQLGLIIVMSITLYVVELKFEKRDQASVIEDPDPIVMKPPVRFVVQKDKNPTVIDKNQVTKVEPKKVKQFKIVKKTINKPKDNLEQKQVNQQQLVNTSSNSDNAKQHTQSNSSDKVVGNQSKAVVFRAQQLTSYPLFKSYKRKLNKQKQLDKFNKNINGFLNRNLRNPIAKKVAVKVYFIVNEDLTIGGIKITFSNKNELTLAEQEQVVDYLTSKFRKDLCLKQPAMIDDKPVRVAFNLPIIMTSSNND